MVQCQHCGEQISPDDAFCSACGADVRGVHGNDGHDGQPQQSGAGGQPQSGAGGQPQGGAGGQPQGGAGGQPQGGAGGQPQGGAGGQPQGGAGGQPQGGAGGQPQGGAGGQPQSGSGGQPRQSPPGQPPQGGQGTSRRNLLKYGAMGGLALTGAGGAWYLLGGSGSDETVLNDFEDGIGNEWNGDLGAYRTVPDSMSGERSAELAFASASEVWRRIPETNASEFSFWWQTGAVDDNEFTVWFHDLGQDEEPAMENAQFGFEVGAGHNIQVVTAPPFENEPGYEVLDRRPRPNTWYKIRFTNIDYEANTFDAALLDRDETVIGEARTVSFAGDPDSLNAIYLRNHMNFSRARARIDRIVQRE